MRSFVRNRSCCRRRSRRWFIFLGSVRSSPAKISYSSFRDNISSGVNFLRRRFSSSDLHDDLGSSSSGVSSSDPTRQQSASGQQYGSSVAAVSDTSSAGIGQQRRIPPGPSGGQSQFGAGSSGVGVGSMGVARGPLQQQDPRTSPNRDRTKLLLVIDEPHVDWSAKWNASFIAIDYSFRRSLRISFDWLGGTSYAWRLEIKIG